jgi:hypothetical protein
VTLRRRYRPPTLIELTMDELLSIEAMPTVIVVHPRPGDDRACVTREANQKYL